MLHLKKTSAVVAALASLVLAPAAMASGGPNPNGGGANGGGGGGGGGGAATCQIRQLSNSGVFFQTATAFDTGIQLAGCANSTYTISYVNAVSGTTDFVASGAVDATGALTASVVAGPLPFNFPYNITLTVTGPTGAVSATKAQNGQFTPQFKD
jgi:hypothetical protein